MVSVARLADFYEAILPGGHDALEVATHDFAELKRKAPDLVRFLPTVDQFQIGFDDKLPKVLISSYEDFPHYRKP